MGTGDTELIESINHALADRYRIERRLGEGGMATVYLAEDLRHHRKVALKVLRPELAAVVGAQRFLAEIQTTANLQHPHILPLFDSGAAGTFLFYVMPYVESESLRELLEKERQLPVDAALALGEKIAMALEYAHEQGVVHRDIKPANVLLSRGEPLVADFGIALALSEAGGGRITETGLSMGTPHYMSPEQAAGERALDKRSDVYSLGCMVYEMLTGRPPHDGPTAQAVLGRILTADPTPPTEHRRSIPTNVEHALLRALQRLPADRFDTAADFARALRDPTYGRGTEAGPTIRAQPPGAARWKAIAVAASATAAVLAGLQVRTLAGVADAGGEPRRQRIVLGSGIESVPGRVGSSVALAPDGSGVLFADTVGAGAGRQYAYWWKSTRETDAVRVPNMEDALVSVFSPDGQWVAYVHNGELRKQPLRGGTTVLLADGVAASGAQALAWLEDGTLVYENAGPILERISEDGGPTDTIATLETVGFPIHASGLIEGGAVLVSSCTDASCAAYRLSLVDIEGGRTGPLADNVLRSWHVEGDWAVYVDRSGAVFTARLDRDALRLGPPVPLFDGVATVGTVPTTPEMHLGADGTLLYRRGGAAATQFRVVWVDREGNFEPVDPSWGRDDFVDLSLAPSGDRLAVGLGAQLWVKELPDGPLTQVTVDEGGASRPDWTPDGGAIAYVSTGGGLSHAMILEAEGGSQAPDTLVVLPIAVYEVLVPDDGSVVFRAGTGGEADLGYVERGGDGTVTWLVDSEFSERAFDLSPDGRWLAYVSNLSGRDEVEVRPFADPRVRRVTVSTNGGTEPVWARSSSELFYRDGEGWMTVATVTTGESFAVTERRRLFDARGYGSSPSHRVYDVSLDDRRLVMLRFADLEDPRGGDLVLVENWFAFLRAAIGR